MLDQVSESPPEQEPLSGADLVHVYARPGATCTVADDRGVCIELHVKVASGDAFVASALGDRLRRGSRVSGRVYDGEAVQTMVFAVEEIEETGGGRADGLLRLIETAERGDERRDARHEFDAAARLLPSEAFAPAPDQRTTPARIADVSRSGMAFVSDRRFSPGENLDLHFEDEAGAAIRCRIQVLRSERAVYGRTRYASRIVAIGEIDQLRLDRLCNRCRLREQAREDQAAEELPLREMLAEGRRQGGFRRLFGRA
jgi:PilZ domain